MNRSTQEPDLLSLPLLTAILALTLVSACLAGCAPRQESPYEPPRLSAQQKQDFLQALEAISAVQTAVPEFGPRNPAVPMKPGTQRLSDKVRQSCRTISAYHPQKGTLMRVALDGTLCPVALTYGHDIQTDLTRETHNIDWEYGVRDEEVRSLNAIDLISLNGYQRATEDTSFGSYSSDAVFSVKGTAHSPVLGEGSLEITGSARKSSDRYSQGRQSTMVLVLQFPTFTAVLRTQESIDNGRAKAEATLNREPLAPSELYQIKMLLPRLGLAYE